MLFTRQSLLALFFIFLSSTSSARELDLSRPLQMLKHGPNCWNSALVVSGVLEHFRFTSAEEFQFLIESPLCQPLPKNQIQTGDIRAYRRFFAPFSAEYQEVHANVVINKEWSFNKMTLFLTAPLQKERESNVEAKYGFTPEVLTLTDLSGRNFHCPKEGCKNSIEYFRCSPVKVPLLKEDPFLYSLYEKTTSALEKDAFRLEPLSEEKRSELIALIANFEQEVRRTCLTESSHATPMACSFYPEAITSFKESLGFKQPPSLWMEEYLHKIGREDLLSKN